MTREALRAMSHSGLRFLETEDHRAIFAPGFRLTFFRAGDCWTHDLAIGEGPAHQRTPIALAVESDPDRDDPSRVVSPSYQEVQPHDFDGGVRVLLTGQSTPHHFSAVITARQDAEGVAIEVDVADRCRAPVAALASTYLVRLGSGALIDADPHRIIWEVDWLCGGRLEFMADGLNSVSLAEAGRHATRVQAIARIEPSTFTQRLVYRWRWTPPSEGA